MVKPKVFLGIGHGGNDPGAVKYIVEKDANLTMGIACKEVLEANGVEVMMSRTRDENDSLEEEIRECNAYNPDLALDIHNNAGGGDGFEAYCHVGGGASQTLALNIEEEVIAIGQNSRGVKKKANSYGADYYGFIRETAAPAAIVEGVFVDNANDVKSADTVEEQKEFGRAYARGIIKTLRDMGKLDKEAKPTNPEAPKQKTVDELAKEVIAGKWGNGGTRKNLLTAAGYDYNAIQKRVDEILSGKTAPTTPAKSVTDLAKEVIAGKWGNGADRKKRLTNAGYDYNAVQKKVDEMLSASKTPKKTVDELAREVIAGKWGNGNARKKALTEAGYDYASVQKRVNELM